MNLLTKIKADQLAARRKYAETGFNKHAIQSSLLGTLYAESAKVGKDKGNRETTDEEVVAVIKKFLKDNRESQGIVKEDTLNDLKVEEELLEGYLPKQLSEADIKAELVQLKTLGVVSVKDVMAHFKTKHSGCYDGGLVSRLAKENSV